LLREINERTVLDAILRLGPISRAQLARDSGLSKPTVSLALRTLAEARLVRDAGRTSGGKGPTATLFELNPKAGWVVGIDVGRDRVRAAIADLSGRIVARRDERARIRSADHLITQIGEIARVVAGEAGPRRHHITFTMVGSPGVLEPSGERVSFADNLPGWGREGILAAVRRELGSNVAFENDVNLAAVGERWRGLGRDVDTFAYLHIGAGVGLGSILGGSLYRGATGAAGEVGYIPFSVDGEPVTNRRGALEMALGEDAVKRLAADAGIDGPRTAARVFSAARRGDARAEEVVETLARRIALAIASFVPVLDPGLVVLGGSVGLQGDLLLEPVRRELAAISPLRPRVEVSPLGTDAVVTGAVASALEEAQHQLFRRRVARGPSS
jgi:predicted NBD/HSP70 family sugar kinase